MSVDIEHYPSYFEEMGWFDHPVYVVWLNGCTDGWPRAIFLEREAAQDWVDKLDYMNPEGCIIDEKYFRELARVIK